MPSVLIALWPTFALIIMGYVLRRGGFAGQAFWEGADRLNYFLLFPALLVGSMTHSPFTSPGLGGIALLILICIALLWLVLLGLRRYYRWPASRFGVLVQGAMRFNTYLGLAAISAVYGSEGLAIAAIVMAIKIPVLNVLSVWALASGPQLQLRQLLGPLAKNPLILACLLGIGLNLSGIGLPLGTDNLVNMLGAGSLPLGLLCVGAALQPAYLLGERRTLLLTSGIKLLLVPALVAVVAWLLGIEGLLAAVVILFFALPTAPTAYALARQLNGDSQLMAGIITLQTLLAMLSLPLVIGLLPASG